MKKLTNFGLVVLSVLLFCVQAAFGQTQQMESPSGPPEPPPIQNRAFRRIADPSGSRTGVTYVRRYQVVAKCEASGGSISRDVFNRSVVSAMQVAAVNDAKLAFVDMDIKSAREIINQVQNSGDYNTNLNSPQKGGFLAPTDTLVLTGHQTYKREHATQVEDSPFFRSEMHTITETVDVRLEGTVKSINEGALAYTLQPVVKRLTSCTSYSNVTQKQDLKVRGRVLIPAHSSREESNSASHEVEMTAQALEQVARQLVLQLETSPSIPIPPPPTRQAENNIQQARSVLPEPELKILGTDVENSLVVYLSCSARLPLRTKILVPMIGEIKGQKLKEYALGEVTSVGYSTTVTLSCLKAGYKIDAEGKPHLQ